VCPKHGAHAFITNDVVNIVKFSLTHSPAPALALALALAFAPLSGLHHQRQGERRGFDCGGFRRVQDSTGGGRAIRPTAGLEGEKRVQARVEQRAKKKRVNARVEKRAQKKSEKARVQARVENKHRRMPANLHPTVNFHSTALQVIGVYDVSYGGENGLNQVSRMCGLVCAFTPDPTPPHTHALTHAHAMHTHIHIHASTQAHTHAHAHTHTHTALSHLSCCLGSPLSDLTRQPDLSWAGNRAIGRNPVQRQVRAGEESDQEVFRRDCTGPRHIVHARTHANTHVYTHIHPLACSLALRVRSKDARVQRLLVSTAR
jgi:hypothetical protein